jgi:hypothetical protein
MIDLTVLDNVVVELMLERAETWFAATPPEERITTEFRVTEGQYRQLHMAAGPGWTGTLLGRPVVVA